MLNLQGGHGAVSLVVSQSNLAQRCDFPAPA
jgi:hypothetical protein